MQRPLRRLHRRLWLVLAPALALAVALALGRRPAPAVNATLPPSPPSAFP